MYAWGERPADGVGDAPVEGFAELFALEVVAGVESVFQIFAEGLAVGFVAESRTAQIAVGIAEEVLLNGGRNSTGLGNVAEVDVGDALEEGVALHDLVVEVRKASQKRRRAMSTAPRSMSTP